MSVHLAFDTARFEEILLENELSQKQARGVRLAVTDALQATAEPLVTQVRLEQVEQRLTAAIEGQGSTLRQALAEASRDQSRWTATLILGALVLNLAAIGGLGVALYNALRP